MLTIIELELKLHNYHCISYRLCHLGFILWAKVKLQPDKCTPAGPKFQGTLDSRSHTCASMTATIKNKNNSHDPQSGQHE